jgi:hypothetical protein
VSWRADERPAALVLRVVPELGGWPIDPSGRVLCGYRAVSGGAALPHDQPVPPGASLQLQVAPSETRMVEITIKGDPIRGEPDVRFRTPLALALPAGWVVAGLREWMGLASPHELVVWVGGALVEPERLLVDAMGLANALVVAPRAE